jgi:FtsP/CotA-like multicopper oxidase with cupredoxin domain
MMGGGKLDLDAIPAGMFSGCKATKGSTEVIHATQSKNGNEKWVAIDIIGSINFLTATVSIDEHDMWVYAMDGGYIEPQKVQAIALSNGDRYSVLIKTTKAGTFKIRSNANSTPQLLVGHAILSVKGQGGNNGSSTSFITIGGAAVSNDVVLFDQSIAHPFPPSPIPEKADAFFPLTMEVVGASYLWAVNYTKLLPTTIEDGLPTLFHPQPYIQNNVTITTRNNTWVDLLFIGASLLMPPHPMHKHGNHMYQIGSGSGTFNWTSTEEAVKHIPESFNLVNPPRRDAFNSLATTTGPTWVMVRYHVTNPGPWLLHCHINNHMAGGMMMVIQDGIDAWPTVPDEYLDFEV